jgi:hypothetical protein
MQETAEGKYTRISEAWSKNFDVVRISQTLLALKGQWGSEETQENVRIAKVGKLVFWQILGAGTKTFKIPKCSYRYYAKIYSESGSLGCVFVETGKEQITISQPNDTRWQAEGVFMQEN